MKIFVHISNEFERTDPNAFIVVECEGEPHIGDVFYLADEQKKDLEEQIIKGGGYGDNWRYMTGTSREKFSIDDAIYVSFVSWERDDQGVFKCHIELGDGIHKW